VLARRICQRILVSAHCKSLSVKAAFHDTDTDILADILARLSARMWLKALQGLDRKCVFSER